MFHARKARSKEGVNVVAHHAALDRPGSYFAVHNNALNCTPPEVSEQNFRDSDYVGKSLEKVLAEFHKHCSSNSEVPIRDHTIPGYEDTPEHRAALAILMPRGNFGSDAPFMTQISKYIEDLRQKTPGARPAASANVESRRTMPPRGRRTFSGLAPESYNLDVAETVQIALALPAALMKKARSATAAWIKFALNYAGNPEILKGLSLGQGNVISTDNFLLWVRYMLVDEPGYPQLKVSTVHGYIPALLRFWKKMGVQFGADCSTQASHTIKNLIRDHRINRHNLPFYDGAPAILPQHLVDILESMPPGVQDYHELRSIFSLAMNCGHRTCTITSLRWEDITVHDSPDGTIQLGLSFDKTKGIGNDAIHCNLDGPAEPTHSAWWWTFPANLLLYMRELLDDPKATFKDIGRLSGRIFSTLDGHYSRRLRTMAYLCGYPESIHLTMHGFRAGT